MEIVVQLPDDIAVQLADAPSIPRQLLEAFALESYRQEKLTRHQVGQLLGLDYWQTEEFLVKHNAIHPYTTADFEVDNASLSRLRQREKAR